MTAKASNAQAFYCLSLDECVAVVVVVVVVVVLVVVAVAVVVVVVGEAVTPAVAAILVINSCDE